MLVIPVLLGFAVLIGFAVLKGFDTMAKRDGGVFLLALWTLCAIPMVALVLWFA